MKSKWAYAVSVIIFVVILGNFGLGILARYHANQYVEAARVMAYQGDSSMFEILYSHAAVTDGTKDGGDEHQFWMQKIAETALDIGQHFLKRGDTVVACRYLKKSAEAGGVEAENILQKSPKLCVDSPAAALKAH